MTFALTQRVPGVTANIPPMVVAGQPLIFAVSPSGKRSRAFSALRCQWRIEREDSPLWGTDQPDEQYLTPRDVKLKTVGNERTFQLPTEPWWRGYLLLTIAPENLDRSIVAAVQIVDTDELDALERELNAATREQADPERTLPTASVETFRIPPTLREAAQYAEGASQLLGPRIRINVRPHQHSLAVMGGFDPRATPRVVGNPEALVRDIVAVVAIIRKRLSEPAPFRIAHQLLSVSRENRQSPPVLFVEFSVPADEEAESGFGLITDGLVQEIHEALGGSDAWEFNVKYLRNRILVVGRVGPFKWPRRRRSQPTMLPV